MVSDALLTARHSVLNIFILRYGISRKEQLVAINRMAETNRLTNVALLVNDISGAGFGYSDYYYSIYHHYGNGYYQEPQEPQKGWKKILGKKKTPYKGDHPIVG